MREVWVFAAVAFLIFGLREGDYVALPASEVLPEIDHQRLAFYAHEPDQHAALKAYRDELRS